ncbi:unnamed protein product [Scytosiphon promiscuus]
MPATKKDPEKLTPFQKRVYEAISGIPAGKVSTYGRVAAALNSSARAVGGALRGNPFAPVVPCHRVVMGDFTIGGFSGSFGDCPDTRRKRKMLEEEGVCFTKDKVAGSSFVHVFPSPSGESTKTEPSPKKKRQRLTRVEQGRSN